MGELTPHGIPLVRVVARTDGLWMTHDNRPPFFVSGT